MKTCKQLVTITLLLTLPFSTVNAETTAGQKAATLASRLGVGTAKLWIDHSTMKIPPSALPASQQSDRINEALKRYQDVKNTYAGVSTAAGGVSIGMETVIAGAALYAGPQAAVTIPLTLIAAASSISLDLANRRVEEIGKKRSQEVLATMREDLIKEAGVADFKALADDPELLRATIVKSNDLLNDVKQRAAATGDPALVGMATDALVKAAQETDIATLDAIAQNAGDIAEVRKDFSKFVTEVRDSHKRVTKELDLQRKGIEALGSDLGELTKDVERVQVEVTKLGRNQELMADFMFSSMPPDQKASALRGGLMDDRIKCPIESPDCDPAQVKIALIERYDVEAAVNVRIATAGKILKGINDVSAITSNLGIDLGEDGNKAIEIASSAVNAYIGFMAGDYLGSIAAVTGIFGKKPDPGAERFKIMMSFLKEQLAVVNEKLDAILKNQQVILDAVTGVSKQLQTTYELLDGRLDQMQVEQERIASNVKALVWTDWKTCYSVFSYAIAPNPSDGDRAFVDRATLRFKTLDDARDVIDGRATDTSECISVVRRAMTSITATQWFGNFLDADRALDPKRLPDPNTLSAAIQDEANRWRDLQRLYKENVFVPSSEISAGYAQRLGVSPSTLLYVNASLIPDLASLASVRKWIEEKNAFSCTSEDPASRVIRGLVCLPGASPDGIAVDITSTMLSTDILLDVSEWMTVVSQLADLYDENNRKFARTMDEVSLLPKVSPGKEIVRKLVDMFSLAIAYNNRMHGGLTAYAITEDVREGRTDEKHIRLLANNPYVAENTANVYLHFIADQNQDRAAPPFSDRYTQAFLYAKGIDDNRFEPLYALFGRRFDFSIADDGRVQMTVRSGDKFAAIPLPAPERFASGAFVFPPRYTALVATRQQLIERYLDYQFGADADLAAIVLQN